MERKFVLTEKQLTDILSTTSRLPWGQVNSIMEILKNAKEFKEQIEEEKETNSDNNS